MKLTKIVLTGVLAAAMMSTSCSSDSNDEMNGVDSTTQSDEHPSSDAEHPAATSGDEHPSSDAEHPSTDAEHPTDATHADGVHESSALVKHEEVKLALLPPAVNESLKSQEYLDYKVERAFVITENDVKTYEIIVKKGEVQSKMLFNAKGIRLDR